MPLTTPDCIDFVNILSEVSIGNAGDTSAGIAITATADLRLIARRDTSPDGHEISFYGRGEPVAGFNVTDGLVVMGALRLEPSPAVSAPPGVDLIIETGNLENTSDIALYGDTEVFLDGHDAVRFVVDGQDSLTFDPYTRATFHGDLLVTPTWGEFNAGIRLPLATSIPQDSRAGEVFYHATEHRVYAHDGTYWHRSEPLT